MVAASKEHEGNSVQKIVLGIEMVMHPIPSKGRGMFFRESSRLPAHGGA
jgi:hypothetical protein